MRNRVRTSQKRWEKIRLAQIPGGPLSPKQRQIVELGELGYGHEVRERNRQGAPLEGATD